MSSVSRSPQENRDRYGPWTISVENWDDDGIKTVNAEAGGDLCLQFRQTIRIVQSGTKLKSNTIHWAYIREWKLRGDELAAINELIKFYHFVQIENQEIDLRERIDLRELVARYSGKNCHINRILDELVTAIPKRDKESHAHLEAIRQKYEK